jgi:DNA repair protein RecO (recombination protein O)
VGVLPDLSLVTTTLEAVFPDGRYVLLPEAGVAAARPEEASVSGTALVDMQAALLHGSLPALQQACSSALPEWKGVLRGLLHYHLGAPVLRTRQVMLELQTLALLPANTARQRPLLAADVGPL